MRNPAYQLFLEEAQELLIILEEGLLVLREQCETAQVHELMRAAHTIKGGASMVGIPSITAIAHRLEDVFRGLYRQDVVIDDTLESLLFQAYDCLESPIVQEVETGSHDEESVLAAAEPVLLQLEEKLGPLATDLEAPEEKLPEMAELGLDMVQLLFSGDVAEGLKRIESLAQESDPIQLNEHLRSQIETFAGIGELTSLPGFVALARTALDALALYPEKIEVIRKVALEDFAKAQAGVLAGDRIQGGEPSDTLKQLAHSVEVELAQGPEAELEAEVEAETEVEVEAETEVELEVEAEVVSTSNDALAETVEPDPLMLGLFGEDAAAIELETDFELGLDESSLFGDLDAEPSTSSGLENDLEFDDLASNDHGAQTDQEAGAQEIDRDRLDNRLELDGFADALDATVPDEDEPVSELLEDALDFDGLEPSDSASSELELDALVSDLDVDAFDVSPLETDDLDPNHLEANGLEVSASDIEALNISDLEADDLEMSSSDIEALDDSSLEANDLEQDSLTGESPDISELDVDELDVSDLESTDLEVDELNLESLDAGESAELDADGMTDEILDINAVASNDLTVEASALDIGDLKVDGLEIDDLESENLDTRDLETETALDTDLLEPPNAEITRDSETPKDDVLSDLEQLLEQPSEVPQSQTTSEDLDAQALDSGAQNVEAPQTSDTEPLTLTPDTLSTVTALTPKLEPIKKRTVKKSPTKTVRVGLERLKRLNNLFGELVTHENKSALQSQQLQSVISSMTQRFRNFESITRNLQDWTDQSHNAYAKLAKRDGQGHPLAGLVSSDYQNLPNSPVAPGDPSFDPLQMDTYGYLYTLAQDVMEEIAQLGETIRDMTVISQQGQQVYRQKQQTLRQIRNDLIRTSMLSLGDLLRHFPRMVREMSNKHGKQVVVKVEGGDTLVDRTVFEKLYDPLVHLVRNAFDHGIEPPELRSHLNKPEQATILLKAYHKGHQTYLEISDDGRGINVEAIRTKAIEQSLYSPEEAAALTHDQLYGCLFMSGFSTAPIVSELSGRGVGLDAVENQVKQLKGSISVVSEPHKGTTFILRFPLTLNIAELLVFTINNHTMALSMDSVEAIISIPMDDIELEEGPPSFCWHDQSVPLYSRTSLLKHYPLRGTTLRESLPAIPLPTDGQVPMVIITNGHKRVALQVDSILQAQELTIKPFGIAVKAPSYLCGCSTLGDGSLIPVIDGQALIVRHQNTQLSSAVQESLAKAAKTRPNALLSDRPISTLPKLQTGQRRTSETSDLAINTGIASSAVAGGDAEQHPDVSPGDFSTILIVDDSLTARHVLVFTLEKAGYQTLQAKDGREALTQLKQNFADIQAVFCDVEMPKMNGFEFLTQCHQEYGDKAPPVIMLTSRSGKKHRQMGADLGASAYLTKPYLEQALLNTLQACLLKRAEDSSNQDLALSN